jgi:hypothetical protein
LTGDESLLVTGPFGVALWLAFLSKRVDEESGAVVPNLPDIRGDLIFGPHELLGARGGGVLGVRCRNPRFAIRLLSIGRRGRMVWVIARDIEHQRTTPRIAP